MLSLQKSEMAEVSEVSEDPKKSKDSDEASNDFLSPAEGPDRETFNSWLMNKVSKQSSMISRAFGEKIIQFLRELREKGPEDPGLRARFDASFRFNTRKRKFQLINVVGLGDILCLPNKDRSKMSHAMLGQHRQVIFKEDMFDVIDNAHRNNDRHRGYKGTFRKINATYCNIPREIVHKYVNMCKFCQKAHACFVPNTLRNGNAKENAGKKPPPKRKKVEIEMDFLTRCQIDILDMQSMPDVDGQFSYIGHFVDHHTKYNVLFPLKRTDALYVAKKLCRYVFGHFGLPQVLHSNLGRKYVDEIISWVLQFWSTDAQIINGSPRMRKLTPIIQQRQKTILILIETIRAKQADSTSWSSWLPGIQYSLNTNQFEPDSAPGFDSVFKRRPKVYSYAPTSKEIPKEEDIVGIETEETLNEVITVSVSDLIQSGPDGQSGLILENLNTLDTENAIVTTSSKDEESQRLKGTAVLQSELLSSSTLSGLSLNQVSLPGEQYTLIGHTIGESGTIQIPVVSLDSDSVSLAVHTGESSHDLSSGHVTNHHDLHRALSSQEAAIASSLGVEPSSIQFQTVDLSGLNEDTSKGNLICVPQSQVESHQHSAHQHSDEGEMQEIHVMSESTLDSAESKDSSQMDTDQEQIEQTIQSLTSDLQTLTDQSHSGHEISSHSGHDISCMNSAGIESASLNGTHISISTSNVDLSNSNVDLNSRGDINLSSSNVGDLSRSDIEMTDCAEPADSDTTKEDSSHMGIESQGTHTSYGVHTRDPEESYIIDRANDESSIMEGEVENASIAVTSIPEGITIERSEYNSRDHAT